MRTIAAALLLASLLVAGCSKVQPLTEVSASLTTLPMPSGAEVVPSVSGAAVESCDATASLRPFDRRRPERGRDPAPRPTDCRCRPEHQPVQLPRSDIWRVAGDSATAAPADG